MVCPRNDVDALVLARMRREATHTHAVPGAQSGRGVRVVPGGLLADRHVDLVELVFGIDRLPVLIVEDMLAPLAIPGHYPTDGGFVQGHQR